MARPAAPGHLREVPQLRPLPSAVGHVPLGEATVDLDLREVRRGDEVAHLTPIEAEALAYLVERAGTLVTREALQRDVWGYAEGVESQTVAVCMRRLRAKLERNPREPEHLRTVRGVGWTLVVGDTGAAEPVDALPRFRTRWVGRDRLAGLVEALGTRRQLTVWGPAGVGKTRAAVELARQLDGVLERRFVPLGAADGPAVVWAGIAAALDVPPPASSHPERAAARLVQVLEARPQAVLVLDECEAHLDTLAPLVERHLAATRPAWLVLTTRRKLDVDGERVHELDALTDDDAVQLFDGLASWRDAAYDARAQRPHVQAIVRAVEGNPLAVELAVARLDLEDPALVSAELAHGPSLGVGRTVRRSIDALAPETRDVLRQLTVFAGPFDVAAVRGVVDAQHAVGSVRTLVDGALVQRRSLPDGVWLSLHAAVREALSDAPVDQALVERHATWFAARAAALRDAADGDPEARVRLLGSLDDFVVALWASLSTPVRARPLLRALAHGRVSRGAVWWLDTLEALHAEDVHDEVDAVLRRYRAQAWIPRGRGAEAVTELAELVFLAQQRGDERELGHLAFVQGMAATFAGRRQEAAQRFDAALERAEDPAARALVLNGQGLLAVHQRDLGLARAKLERTVALYREADQPLNAGRALLNLVSVRTRTGDPTGAVAACREALQTAEDFGDASGTCTARLALGTLLLEQGRHRDARGALSIGLASARRAADRVNEGVALIVLGYLDAETDQLERGRRRVADAQSLLERSGHRAHLASADVAATMLAWAAGDRDEAEARLRHRLGQAGDRSSVRAVCAALLGHLLDGDGRSDEASRWTRDATGHVDGDAALRLLRGEAVRDPPLQGFEVRMLQRLGWADGPR